MRCFRLFVIVGLAATACALAGGAQAEPAKHAAPRSARHAPDAERGDVARWCAPETETLAHDVCHVDGAGEGRRTLVIFLHGVIAPNTTWQWTQQRAIVNAAKALKFVALMPPAPRGRDASAWPTSQKAQEEVEDTLLAQWAAARRTLEERAGRPFDDVFVMGFSSGAYYAGSLAVRTKLDADGYAVFAGGAGGGGRIGTGKRAPVFVAVSAADETTVAHSRAFASSLGTMGWPHRVEERDVGHAVDGTMLTHAFGWLRAMHASHAK